MRVCSLYLKGFDLENLDKCVLKIKNIAHIMNISVSNGISFPKKTNSFTLIRSPHVNKTSREQFELREHRRLIEINSVDFIYLSVFLEYVKQHLPSGVSVRLEMCTNEMYYI